MRKTIVALATIAVATVASATAVIAGVHPANGEPDRADTAAQTVRLVTDLGSGTSGRYLSVVENPALYPGLRAERFTSLDRARAAAIEWNVEDAGAGRYRLYTVSEFSGRHFCLIPHTHVVNGQRTPLLITTACNATDEDQQLEVVDGSLRFRSVQGYDLPPVWVSGTTVTENGSEYPLRSEAADTTWLELPGGPADEYTVRSSFPDDTAAPVVFSGTGARGAEIVVSRRGERVAQARVDDAGTWSTGVPAPNAGGVHEFSVVAVEDGEEQWRDTVAVDYGAAVEITSPEAGATIGDGPVRVTGRGEPGADVEVAFEGGATVTTKVGPNGTWTADVPR